jgi:hypothetical protein
MKACIVKNIEPEIDFHQNYFNTNHHSSETIKNYSHKDNSMEDNTG